MMEQLTLLVRSLTISQRIGIVFGSLFSVLLLVGLVMWAGTPQMQTAFSNVAAKDATTITESLASAGIPYELADGGATIKVPTSQLSAAKVAAGTAGYLGGDATGWEIWDQQSLGASETENEVKLLRAKEQKAVNTIKKMDGVQDVSVSIVLAETGVLAGSDRPATASVYVRMAGGARPSDALVQGIVVTVAGSVAGLQPTSVTVVDADGTVLAGDDNATSRAATLQGTVERTLSAKAQLLLDKVLGAGNSAVAVTADLDLDKVEKQVKTIKPINVDNQTILSWQRNWETLGADGTTGAGGIPGTTSNVPGLPTYPNASAPTGSPSASAAASPGYDKGSETVNYANSEEIANIVQQPGTIQRLSVAVLVNASAFGPDVTAEQRDAIVGNLKNAVFAAVGAVQQLDTQGNKVATGRQDTVDVQTLAFAAAVVLPEAGTDYVGMILAALPTVGGVLLALVLVLLVWRNMRALKGRAEEMQLTALRMQVPSLEAGSYAPAMRGGGFEMAELSAPPSAQARIQEKIRLVAEEDPDGLAGLAAAWLSEDAKTASRRR